MVGKRRQGTGAGGTRRRTQCGRRSNGRPRGTFGRAHDHLSTRRTCTRSQNGSTPSSTRQRTPVRESEVLGVPTDEHTAEMGALALEATQHLVAGLEALGHKQEHPGEHAEPRSRPRGRSTGRTAMRSPVSRPTPTPACRSGRSRCTADTRTSPRPSSSRHPHVVLAAQEQLSSRWAAARASLPSFRARSGRRRSIRGRRTTKRTKTSTPRRIRRPEEALHPTFRYHTSGSEALPPRLDVPQPSPLARHRDLDPAREVPARSTLAELHDPRPDALGRSGQRGGAVDDDPGVGHDPVPGERRGHLVVGDAGATAEPGRADQHRAEQGRNRACVASARVCRALSGRAAEHPTTHVLLAVSEFATRPAYACGSISVRKA